MAAYQQGIVIEITDTFRLAGVETDPTTVVYTVLAPDGTETTYTWPGSLAITHPGVGQFVLNLGAPAVVGNYTYDVVSTGTVVASRAGAFTVIANVTSDANAWPSVGPCAPWVSSQDVWACCGSPTVVIDGDTCPVDFTTYAMSATQILYALSGRQFSGLCGPRTVRPYCDSCWCGYQILSRGYVIGPWDYGYPLYLCDSCLIACSPSMVKLAGYPIREILEVKIDGAVVAASEYNVWNDRYLKRLNDERWPVVQDLTLEDTEDETFSITYSYGVDPPLAGLGAATELACQLYLSCNGGECALPQGTTRVTQQGVVVEKLAFTAWAYRNSEWRTGLVQVDAFLNAFNPNGLRRRPTFWAPGKRQYAQQFGR